MLKAAEKAYCLALLALKRKEFSVAADHFEQATDFFAANEEFTLLRETTRLLLAVKKELGHPESGESNESTVIEEVSYGQEDELR